MNRRVYDFWVGVFVMLGLAALVFLALRVSNVSSSGGKPTYRVSAAFDNIGGLKARAPIKSAGVLVGRVASIQLDPTTYRAVVAMDIEQEFKFSRDSSAEILTSGILGDQYIGIEAGAEEAMLKAGDKIALTSSAVVLEKLISQFMFSKAAENPSSDTPAQ